MTLLAPLIVHRCQASSTSASARFRIGRKTSVVRFDGVAPDGRTAGEAFVSLARVLTMRSGRMVASTHPVSRECRRRSDAYAAAALALFPRTQHPVSLLALLRRRIVNAPRKRRVAAFFSGGVDSLDLLLQHADTIDDLVFVRGFDVPLEDTSRTGEVMRPVRAMAEAAGKPLLVVETNLRAFSDAHADWTWFVYGGLIGTSILLARTHRLVLCAASVADRHLPPEVARLRSVAFGNDLVEMRLARTSATRIEKIQAIADAGIARDTLRVCWQNVPGTVNCGRCAKCIRTMVGFAALGRVDETRAFPVALDLKAVAAQAAVTRSDRAFLLENLEAARSNGVTALAHALQTALDTGPPSAETCCQIRP